MLSYAFIVPFPVNAFPNMPAANVPNNIERNSPFHCFASFLIVSLIPYISNLDFSRDLTIFNISSISSSAFINAAIPDS